MSGHVIAVDLFALLLAAIGFHMAFRQGVVRRGYRRVHPRDAAHPRKVRADGEDPAQYALLIFGMMILAFGIILFGFTTAYALFTRTPVS